jgi:uncharacterized protein
VTELLAMTAASMLAGCIDAIAGGGGLILVPALLGTFPNVAPALLLGTNKGAALCGTSWAAARYVRGVRIKWPVILPAITAALLGSATGAFAVTRLPSAGLRKAIPLLLVCMLAYTLSDKQLGRVQVRALNERSERLRCLAIGLIVGFYDGFLGPGAGSMFTFAIVRLLGYDFLRATASAKLLNMATNVAALLLFATLGQVWWQYALCMGLSNALGSVVGTHLALRYGSDFVRTAFIVVVSGLLLKTGHDSWLASREASERGVQTASRFSFDLARPRAVGL